MEPKIRSDLDLRDIKERAQETEQAAEEIRRQEEQQGLDQHQRFMRGKLTDKEWNDLLSGQNTSD